MNIRGLVISVLVLSCVTPVQASEQDNGVKLAGVFSQHMVLQRDRPSRVWGTGQAGRSFELALDKFSQSVKVNDSGQWSAVIPAMQAGGPYELTLTDGGITLASVNDILFGDVYLCSGQSNMFFPVSRSSGRNRNLFEPDEQIRLLPIHKDSAVKPKRQHSTLPQWQLSTVDSVADFSAVCWFFARELMETASVPLGLIHASWGGSRIEAWMSADSLRAKGNHEDELELLSLFASDPGGGTALYAHRWEAWWSGTAEAGITPWKREQQDHWKPVHGPMRDWKLYGDPEVKDHLGMLWYSHDFELTAEQAAQTATLYLGKIDAVDMSWVNGIPIGAQFGWATERVYADLQGVLKPGINNVTVNIYNSSGLGGLLGPDETMGVLLSGGDFISLSDSWRYQKIDKSMGAPPGAPWFSINGLTGLYNAMLSPLLGLNLTAALWYQGESNAGSAEEYEQLLASMIDDWRSQFDDNMKFITVQLPGFGATNPAPVNSGWARLRHAQQQVALKDDQTGMVVTLGAGDPFDIHPTNKQVVGQRAAKVAASLVYGHPGVVDGIAPLSAYQEGSVVTLQFDPAQGALQVMGSLTPAAFEVCGAAPDSCRFVDATLHEKTIELSVPDEVNVHLVRHCWADSPRCNLYDAAGLPVSSFEIVVSE